VQWPRSRARVYSNTIRGNLKRHVQLGTSADFAGCEDRRRRASNRHRSPHAMPAAQEIYMDLTAARAAAHQIGIDTGGDLVPSRVEMAGRVPSVRKTRVARGSSSENRIAADAHGASMAVPQTSPSPWLSAYRPPKIGRPRFHRQNQIGALRNVADVHVPRLERGDDAVQAGFGGRPHRSSR